MKTKMDLLYECWCLSRNFNFPDEIEVALENDYVANRHLYDEAVLKNVAALLLIVSNISPQDVLNAVRNHRSGYKESSEQDEL